MTGRNLTNGFQSLIYYKFKLAYILYLLIFRLIDMAVFEPNFNPIGISRLSLSEGQGTSRCEATVYKAQDTPVPLQLHHLLQRQTNNRAFTNIFSQWEQKSVVQHRFLIAYFKNFPKVLTGVYQMNEAQSLRYITLS